MSRDEDFVFKELLPINPFILFDLTVFLNSAVMNFLIVRASCMKYHIACEWIIL